MLNTSRRAQRCSQALGHTALELGSPSHRGGLHPKGFGAKASDPSHPPGLVHLQEGQLEPPTHMH